MNRAEHAREHFLGVRAARGAIPAAHLARHHGRAQGVLGAPVGGVDRVGLEQESKDGGEFDRKMRREIPCDAAASRLVDEDIELEATCPLVERMAESSAYSVMEASIA